MSDDDPYRGTKPTQPKQSAVRVPVERGVDEEEVMMQRCPLCIGHGYIPPEHAIAFEAFCAKLNEEQK